MGYEASPPAPFIQKINAVLHLEPLSTIVYGCFWSFVLVLFSPVVVTILVLRTIYRLLVGALFPGRKNAFDPTAVADREMAVVITGCDTGFGMEMALWAADAGYTVFAGCFNDPAKSWPAASLTRGTIIPVAMDVTKDAPVQASVATVTAWLKERSKDKGVGPTKTRVLHCLINNAGVGVGGLVDWTDLSYFQQCMDGKYHVIKWNEVYSHRHFSLFVYRYCRIPEHNNDLNLHTLLHSYIPRSVFILIVNYIGQVRLCKAYLPIFIDQAIRGIHSGGMRIFNITSMAGLVASGLPGFSAYCGSKHAANAFSTILRGELKGFGIQVTTINPSFHGTALVNTMGDKLTTLWDSLEATKKAEYGQGMYSVVLFL